MEPPTDAETLRSQVANLRTELDDLRARYDTLYEAHNRAGERYKADYKKWREFKQWLFKDADKDEHVHSSLKPDELRAYAKASVLGKRKQFEECGPNVDDDDIKDFKLESPAVGDVKVGLPQSSPVTVASRHQRSKSYHGESSQKLLSPSPSNNQDPFLVPLSTNCDSSELHNNTGRWASSCCMDCARRMVRRDAT